MFHLSLNKASILFLFLVALTVPLTTIKIFDIQAVEFAILFSLAFAFVFLIKAKFSIVLPKNVRWIVFLLGIIIGLCSLFAIVSLLRPFYPPNDELSIAKSPGFLSLARIIQLLIMMAGFLLCTLCMIKSKRNMSVLFSLYSIAGTIIALYAILSWFLLKNGISIGGALRVGKWIRARGMFVEGGNYGLYLVSVIAATIICCFVLHVFTKKTFYFSMVIQVVAFILSYSKAGIITVLSMGLVLILLTLRKKLKIAIIALVLMGVVFMQSDFIVRGIGSYYESYRLFEKLIETHQNDNNLLLGRVMAMYLAPRMIQAHPFIGIGIGNYSLVRNSPEYLQGYPQTTFWDLPGLGLFGYIAELGIPIVVLILIAITIPFFACLKHKMNILVIAISSFQLFAHLYGVQITFFYPWLFSAAMLALVMNRNAVKISEVNVFKNYEK